MLSEHSRHWTHALYARLQRLSTWPRTQMQPPRWRHPLVGYFVGLLLVAFGLSIGLVETQVLFPFSFPGVLLLFAVALVAFFWGALPALFTVLLSLGVLDYLYVPPFGIIGSSGWSGILQLLTFAGAGVAVAVLAHQREAARIRAVVAEQEAVLRANELAATFEAMSDSVVVYNARGQVRSTNAATQHIFSLSSLPLQEQEQAKQELLLQAVRSDAQGHLLPEKQQPLSRVFKGSLLTGNNTADVLVQTPDKRSIILNLSAAPIKNQGGGFERAVVIYRDVTARRHLEERTSEALQAMLAMVEALVQYPEQLVPDEHETRSAHTNEETFLGQRMVELTRSVIESMHVVMLSVEPEDDTVSLIASTGFSAEQEQALQKQFQLSSELADMLPSEERLAELKADTCIVLEGMTLPLHTPVLPYYVDTVLVAPICVGNLLVGLLCVDDGSRPHTYRPSEMMLLQTIARLTALILTRSQLVRERAEAQANERVIREAHQRMEELLGVVSHELKTPLTVMRGSLQLADRKIQRLVASEALHPDEMQRFAPVQALIERARNQVAVQDHLVSDLLDASRVQAQTLSLLPSSSNLVSIVQEAIEEQRQADPTRILHLSLPNAKEVLVYADAERLMQVVKNYLTNALKYSAPDEPVEVVLRVEGSNAYVSVRDKGPGLSVEEQQRVWERFYRVPNVEVQYTAVPHVGLGVGLYICRSIIERHQGQVGVESKVGEGSTFWFSLPTRMQERKDGVPA